ncbi:MAG: ATP-binding protein, partial [Maribacter sp.]|nr:ATP-binding protein [Maribacter sp.]
MILQPILALIILSSLRKQLKNTGFLLKWHKILLAGSAFCIALIIIYAVVAGSHSLVSWVSHAVAFAIVYLILTQKDFSASKTFMYAFLPLMSLNFIEDVVKLLFPTLFTSWENYFDTGVLFTIIWLGAMVIITNKQKKVLERERLKAKEKEKEFKITAALKAELEVQVKERTIELTKQKEELLHTLNELKATQSQLVQSEKMASLGELTAGIAHEIQNPLNFVNNFSEVSMELLTEMTEELNKGDVVEVKALANDIRQNLEKINHHGKRADAIVKGMLQHSRSSSGQQELSDINALCDEYLRLAYHGLRAKDKGFNATLNTDFDTSIGKIKVVPQEMGRVILNLISNAFYAVNERKTLGITGYEPTVAVTTKKIGNQVEISVRDNGNGIPEKMLEKIFQPFFTTKPTGQGTGLGLSLSYDIVKAHGGELKVETKEGE